MPRVHVDPRFKTACRTSGLPVLQMAALGGFTVYTHLSRLLNTSGPLRLSDLNLTRLQRLADRIGYRGPIVLPAVAETPQPHAEAMS